jgi:hypothetical protein
MSMRRGFDHARKQRAVMHDHAMGAAGRKKPRKSKIKDMRGLTDCIVKPRWLGKEAKR